MDDDGPVERWLDEVFDGLTGTGAGGRRALAEAEDHLRSAVSEGLGQGLSPAEAERRAVDRFGPPEKVARGIRAAYANRLRPAVTGVLLLGAAVLLAAGLSTTVAAGLYLAVDRTYLADNTRLAVEGLAAVAAGLLVLSGLGLARRYTPMREARWRPTRRRRLAVAVLFAVVTGGVLGDPLNNFGVPQFGGYSPAIPVLCALGSTAAALALTYRRA